MQPVMETNPYRPPDSEDVVVAPDLKTIREIRPPTTALILLLASQLLVYAVGGFLLLVQTAVGEPLSASPVEIGLAGVHILISIYMLRCMFHLRRLTRLRDGRLAAGLSCIPFVTPCLWLGLPFGVWLAILLAKPTIAAAFGTANQASGPQ